MVTFLSVCPRLPFPWDSGCSCPEVCWSWFNNQLVEEGPGGGSVSPTPREKPAPACPDRSRPQDTSWTLVSSPPPPTPRSGSPCLGMPEDVSRSHPVLPACPAPSGQSPLGASDLCPGKHLHVSGSHCILLSPRLVPPPALRFPCPCLSPPPSLLPHSLLPHPGWVSSPHLLRPSGWASSSPTIRLHF